MQPAKILLPCQFKFKPNSILLCTLCLSSLKRCPRQQSKAAVLDLLFVFSLNKYRSCSCYIVNVPHCFIYVEKCSQTSF